MDILNKYKVKHINKKKIGIFFFLFCRLLSSIAEQLNVYAIPLIIFEFTKQASKSGEAYLIEWLPSVLLLPFIGILVDIFKERYVYIIGDIIRCLTCLVGLIVITINPSYTYVTLALAASILAILNSQNFVALETTIGRNFEDDEVPFMQTCIQGIESTSEVISPILAGVLVVLIPKSSFLLITSAMFFVTGFGIIGLPKNNKKNPVDIKQKGSFISIIKDVKKGFYIIFNNFPLVLLVGLTFLTNFIFGTITALNPAILIGNLNITSEKYALVSLFGGITQVIVLILLSCTIRKLNLKYIGILSCIFIGSSGYVLGLTRSFYIYILGYSLIVSGISIFNVFLRSERIKLIPKESFGKVMGSIVFFNRLSLPLAGLVVAKGTLLVTSQQILLIIACLCSIVIIILLSLFFKFRTRANVNI